MAGINYGVAVPILEATNFNNWHFRIKTILKKEQCEDALNPPPAANSAADVLANFKKIDAKAQSVIVQGVSDKHLDILKDCTTAKEQMDALKSVFNRTSSFTKLSLWRKLFNLKSSSSDKLEDHFLKFDTIIRELNDLGSNIDESDRVCHLLLSLPSKFDTVVTALETISDVKMDFVKARLLDEEMKFTTKGESKLDRNHEVSFKVSNKTCYSCGSLEHFRAQCPKANAKNYNQYNRGSYRQHFRGRGNHYRGNQKHNQQANTVEEPIMLYAANVCTEDIDKPEFVLDSGASNHFVKESLAKYMYDIKILEHSVSIYIANGEILKTNKVGTLKAKCQGVTIHIEALIVPKIKHNLLSASKMTSKGHKIIVEKDKTTIKGNNFSLRCKNRNGLYVLYIDSFIENNQNCNIADENVWHKRLGHPSRDVLKQLGFNISNKICSVCIEGKATRCPFTINERRSKAIGELVHSDISGPISPCTLEGEKYFQVILDDFSHFVIVKLLKHKYEAEENLKDYITEVERQHGIKVKRFRLDNGGEFSSRDFKHFCKQKGIHLEYTIAYSPQMNGKSERMNRTLLNMVRTKIIDSSIPKTLWGEALKCSAYELNRTPTSALPQGKTPSEIWHGRNDLSKLRIFGCRAWYTVLPKESKLEQRAKKAVFIGYCGGGYRLYLPEEEKVIKSRDVRFDENVMFFKENMEYQPVLVYENCVDNINDNDRVGEKRNERDETEDTTDTEEFEESEKASSSNLENAPLPIEITRSGRSVSKPNYLNDYETYAAYCLLSTTDEPKTFKEACESPEWLQAINSELDSHQKLQTWTPSKLPEGQAAIDTKWVFKIKDDGTKKARLVARGFQVPNTGEEYSYAPVCRLTTIRLLLSISVQKDWNLTQIDVPTAFLNGLLDTDVYIKSPEGLTGSKYLKLKRALYGLRNAPKCWNMKFNEVMLNLNFRRSEYDYCLYIKNQVYLVLFVDDALIIGPDQQVKILVNNLYEHFKVKHVQNVNKFLGMEINKTDAGLKISQTNMIGRLLEEFGMEHCRPISTPMETNFQIETSEEILHNIPYRRLICSLMYISINSRPDIAYSVSYLSRYLDKPTASAWKAGKRILKYLSCTKDYGLMYRKSDTGLEAMSDADWGGDKQTRKSVSGFVCFHASNLIAWHSRKQNCIALSSMEAEYVSAGSAAQEIVHLKGILSEFGENKPITLRIDNLSAISLIKTFENSKRSKHIEIKHHYIKELWLNKVLEIGYITSSENCADILTKSLCKEKFQKLCLYLINK